MADESTKPDPAESGAAPAADLADATDSADVTSPADTTTDATDSADVTSPADTTTDATDSADATPPDAATANAEALDAPPATESAPPATRTIPRVSRRTVGLSVAFVALVAVIVVNVVIISKARRERAGPVASVASANPAVPSAAPTAVPTATATGKTTAAAVKRTSVSGELFEGEEPSPQPPSEPAPPKKKRTYPSKGTVLDAASRGCSTRSVDGLSRQIIAQARCIDARAFSPVPRRSNLKAPSNVFLYLEAPARDHLLKALDANKKQTMTVNSALRTVAQQYLLRRWSLKKVCGIQLATPPGESNHETGLALDIREHGTWKKALEAEGFRWLGSIDRVHFDYKGADAATLPHLDIRAFQQLWNLNHPDDRIPVNGRYTPDVEDKLESSPANGFPRGPSCKR